jgi:hypothetical protein
MTDKCRVIFTLLILQIRDAFPSLNHRGHHERSRQEKRRKQELRRRPEEEGQRPVEAELQDKEAAARSFHGTEEPTKDDEIGVDMTSGEDERPVEAELQDMEAAMRPYHGTEELTQDDKDQKQIRVNILEDMMSGEYERPVEAVKKDEKAATRSEDELLETSDIEDQKQVRAASLEYTRPVTVSDGEAATADRQLEVKAAEILDSGNRMSPGEKAESSRQEDASCEEDKRLDQEDQERNHEGPLSRGENDVIIGGGEEMMTEVQPLQLNESLQLSVSSKEKKDRRWNKDETQTEIVGRKTNDLEQDQSVLDRKEEMKSSEQQGNEEEAHVEVLESELMKSEEGNSVDKEEPKLMDKEEPKLMGKEEPKLMGKEEPKLMGKEEPKLMRKEEPKLMDKEEPQLMAKEEPQLMDKEEPQLMDKEEPQLMDKEEPQLMDKEEHQLMDKEEPQLMDKEEPQLMDKEKPQLVGQEEHQLMEKVQEDLNKQEKRRVEEERPKQDEDEVGERANCIGVKVGEDLHSREFKAGLLWIRIVCNPDQNFNLIRIQNSMWMRIRAKQKYKQFFCKLFFIVWHTIFISAIAFFSIIQIIKHLFKYLSFNLSPDLEN